MTLCGRGTFRHVYCFSSTFLYFVVRIRRHRKKFTFAISSCGSFPQATLADPTVVKWEGATGSFRTNPPSCTYAVTKFPQYLAVSSVAHEQVGTHTHMSSKANPMALF